MILAAAVGAVCALALWMLAQPFLTSTRSGSRRARRVRITAVLAVVSAGVLAVSALLLDPGTGLPGDPRRPVQAAAGTSAATAPVGAVLEPTASEIAAVESAVDRVRQEPRSVAAHVALARTYSEAGQPQLATVEYLAATRLDPDNAEANTALALVAFRSGNHRSAKSMVDRALSRRPRYPEGLYARGLINAMGLDRPAAARRDFRAYLEAAPFGSHQLTVETLLALIDGGEE